MKQESSDLLFGVAVLIPFLIGVFVLGWLISRFKNRRFAGAWQPLVRIIGGTVVEDGGGAATSWLTGTFEGRQVHASMTPNRNRSNESGLRYHHFEATLQNVPGRVDWQVAYKAGMIGFGKESWQIHADDPVVADRLQRAGVVDLIRPLAEARAVPPWLRRSVLEPHVDGQLQRGRRHIVDPIAGPISRAARLADPPRAGERRRQPKTT